MVDVRKKLSDIALQDPCGSCVIMRHDTSIITKAVDGAMRALAPAAGIRVEDEFLVEIWVENPIDGVMQEPVAYGRFVDISWLWVADLKSPVRTVSVRFVRKVAVESKDVVGQAN